MQGLQGDVHSNEKQLFFNSLTWVLEARHGVGLRAREEVLWKWESMLFHHSLLWAWTKPPPIWHHCLLPDKQQNVVGLGNGGKDQ